MGARGIAIVDFDSALENRVAAALGTRIDVGFVTRGLSWEPALTDQLATLQPDIVLLDVGSNGDGRIQAVRRASPRSRIIVRVSGDDATALALQHGANGLIADDSDADVVLHAVERVNDGATFLDPRLASRLVRLATRGHRVEGPFGLTLQEMRVLELLARGLTNRQIADELGLGIATVKTHVYNVMRKLRVRNRTEAAGVAMRNGLA